jgi:hypothetical protein
MKAVIVETCVGAMDGDVGERTILAVRIQVEVGIFGRDSPDIAERGRVVRGESNHDLPGFHLRKFRRDHHRPACAADCLGGDERVATSAQYCYLTYIP